MLVVVVLFATVLLRAVIVTTFVMLPKQRTCPRCGAQLALIRHTLLRVLVPAVEHRWCLDCGWSGVVRLRMPSTHP